MSPDLPVALQEIAYEREAQAYLRSLPLEHFMEATPQGTQRKITLESLDLLDLRRLDVHVFNELLVQYPRRGRSKPGQVVPDNMVVLTTQPIRAESSYNVPLEPARPFWVLEYVSKTNRRKDYEDNFRKYERELKVPYYLVFHPEAGELTLYRHNKRKYVTVKATTQGRLPIQELDLEVGLLEGWVRFWYQGELLPLPVDLQRDLDATRRELQEARQEAKEARQEAIQLQDRLRAAERQLAELRARSKDT
jgi:Uma2 family endonuclease